MLSYDNAGSFLEVGCHTGRLIYYLHMFCPNWKYTGVDPWDEIVMWVANDISTSIEKVQKEFGVSVRHCNTNYRLVSVVSFNNLKQAKEINEYIVKKLSEFWEEDMPNGDATTQCTIPENITIKAEILAVEELVFAGNIIIPLCFG